MPNDNDSKKTSPLLTRAPLLLSKEEMEALQSKIKKTRDQALQGLRKTGAVLDFNSDRNRIKVVVDSIDVEISNDGEFKVSIDGHDVSESVKTVNIQASRTDFPQVMIVFKPKISFVKKGDNGLVL